MMSSIILTKDGIFDSLETRFLIFEEERIGDLIDHLKKADLIIGFNIKKLDYKVSSSISSCLWSVCVCVCPWLKYDKKLNHHHP